MIEEPVLLLIWSCPKILFTCWDVLGRTFFFSKVACGLFRLIQHLDGSGGKVDLSGSFSLYRSV